MTLANPILRRILLISGVIFTYVIAYTLMIALLNGGVPNRILTPLPQYYSLFSVLWDENAWAALTLMAHKSFFVIAHKDPRSGLNLWTMDIDAITFTIYLIVAWLISGRLLLSRQQLTTKRRTLALTGALSGSALVLLSVSYMSVVDHCAGPTWAGFVSLYGMGASEFELYPAYQIIMAILGSLLFSASIYLDRSSPNSPLTM